MPDDIKLSLLLVAGALAAGCSREPDRAAAGDSAHASPNSAALTVTAHGIGPLRAGMTLAEASQALGGALVVPAQADTAGCRYVQWRGGPRGVRLMVEGGRVVRVDVDSAGVRTVVGAGVGDTEEQLRRLYPAHMAVAPHKYEDGHYLTVTDPADSSFAIVFETTGGKVARYRAGLRPQVEYVEGCG
jgi:hypothetical protein